MTAVSPFAERTIKNSCNALLISYSVVKLCHLFLHENVYLSCDILNCCIKFCQPVHFSPRCKLLQCKQKIPGVCSHTGLHCTLQCDLK